MTLHRRDGSEVVPVPGTSVARTTSSAVVYRLGGRDYPMRTVPQCKVCMSEFRVEIERALIKSYGYAAIHRSLPDSGQQALSVRNIQDHAKDHLPVDEHVRRAVIESRAREIGLDPEGTTALVDQISFAKVGLQKVYEGMAEGSLRPDVKDGIAFANLLLKVEEQAGEGVDDEMMFRGFMVYLQAIRAVCTPEQVREIGSKIAADPLMKALLGRSSRVTEEQASD